MDAGSRAEVNHGWFAKRSGIAKGGATFNWAASWLQDDFVPFDSHKLLVLLALLVITDCLFSK